MSKSFWGRLEKQKARPVKPAKAPRRPRPRTGGEKREARLLAMLDKGTADEALRHAQSLVDETRRARGLAPSASPSPGKVAG